MSTRIKKVARAILLHLATDRTQVGPDHPAWAWACEQARKIDDALTKYNQSKT
jgi:hypothetical protein